MEVVFVNFGRENLGIEYLSSILKGAGFKTGLVNETGIFSKEDNVFHLPLLEKLFEQKKEVIEKIIKLRPHIVAFSVYTPTYGWACEIASEIKKNSDAVIVFGGVHPTLLPRESIQHDFVDFVIRGEGETAFLELVRALNNDFQFEDVGNLLYKKGKMIIENRLHAFIENLDTLPLPDKGLFERDVCFKDDYLIMTSRGCLYNCSYCCESYFSKLYNNKYFRRRSVNSVVEELSIMKEKYNFKEVMFFDSILFTDRQWLKDLLSRFKNEIGVPFRCTGHVNFLDYEVGKLLKEAGCYCVEFGIQTFNQKIRKEILNRQEDNLQIRKALTICDSLKLRYDLDLMFGVPGVKEEDYLSALEFLKRNTYLNRIKCYNLAYYPGLTILDKAKHLGFLNDKDIEGIKNGIINDWFHSDFIKDAAHKKWKNDFQKIYKIYPILPIFMRNFIVRHKLYNRLPCLIPGFLVIFIQLINGMVKNDYRFYIYIHNYFYQLKRYLLNKRFNMSLYSRKIKQK